MSNLVTEENDVERNLSCNENNKNRSASAMFLYLRELFFLFALVFTSYTALFNSLPKVGKPPAPIPFFPKDSVVVDHYRGTVNVAFQKASEVDLTVIMYYAPWDAESQAARYEFEAAAQLLHEEVYFTAISCWSPNTECKQHVPRIRHFPVIVAYPQHSKGIHYQGPLKSVYIINFVKTLMRPINRILSPLDIVGLLGKHNVLLVGSFLFSGNLGGPGYYTFYSAALKMLEKDPFHEIAFAVTTDRETAAAIDFESVPSVRLYLWNETFDYHADADYTDESLNKWIWLKMHHVVQWVSPPKVKSRMLSPHIIEGPALILFTPRNPLQGVNPMYSLLREIAFKYHNCHNSTWVNYLSGYIEGKNQDLENSNQELEKLCLKKKRKRELYRSSIFMPSVIVPDSLLNTSECMKQEDVCDAGSFHSKYLGPQSEACFRRSKIINSNLNSHNFKNRYGNSVTLDVDDKSPENLVDHWEDYKCRSLDHAAEYYNLPYPNLLMSSNETINGLACVNNRTLSIIAMDSLSNYQFAEGLGINILLVKDKTAAAIINKQEESQYILEEQVSKDSLVKFIVNHTNSGLRRFLRSSHDASARSVTRYRYPVRKDENCTHTNTESCVPELNSKNFLDFVSNQSRAVIIFYHTPYCALCRSISHLFLLLSRYFRHFPGLQFARIDGDNNDLPWEYTMDLFPAVLFFPTVMKSESRLYDSNLPFTIRNLIHFVLANLEPEAKIPAMISLCISFEKLQSESEARKCKSKIQKESYDHLSKTLKDVRRIMSRWKNLSPSSNFQTEIRHRKKILLHKASKNLTALPHKPYPNVSPTIQLPASSVEKHRLLYVWSAKRLDMAYEMRDQTKGKNLPVLGEET